MSEGGKRGWACLQEAAGGGKELLQGVRVEGDDAVPGVLDVRRGQHFHQLGPVKLVRIAILWDGPDSSFGLGLAVGFIGFEFETSVALRRRRSNYTTYC